MMLDVGARPALAVDRTDPRRHPFGAPPEPRLVEQLRAAIPRRVHANERDEFHDVALDQLHLAVHEGLGGAEPRVEEDARSEEHTSELQSLMRISYAVFCLKKKKHKKQQNKQKMKHITKQVR